MNLNTSVLIQAFAPFPTLSVLVPDTTDISGLFPLINDKYPSFPLSLASSLVFSKHSGHVLLPQSPISNLKATSTNIVSLRLSPRLLGGKGGFGSQLRAAGGRMSSRKTDNNDSCRDLTGRRLSTMKVEEKLVAYIQSEPKRLAAKAEAQEAKLKYLEHQLGIEPSSSSSAASNILPEKKRRFDDTEYLGQSRELIDGVKSAVATALLKRKKKAKLSHPNNFSNTDVITKGGVKPSHPNDSSNTDVMKEGRVKLAHPNDSSSTDVMTEGSEDKLPVKAVDVTVVSTTTIALDAVGA